MNTLKTLKTKTWIFFVVMTIAASFYSCKKEAASEILNTNEQQRLRQWYTANVSTDKQNPFNTLTPNWDAVQIKEVNGQIVYEIEMNNPEKIFIGYEHTNKNKADAILSRNDTRFLVFENKKSGLLENGCYMSIVNTGTQNNVKSVHYREPGNLTGNILYFNPNGTMANGWSYRDGSTLQRIGISNEKEYKASMRLKQEEANLRQKNGGKIAIKQAVICTPEYVIVYGTSCAGVDGFMNCTQYVVSRNYVNNCDLYGGGDSDGGYTPPAPTGGGTGESNPTTPPKVDVDPNARPCLGDTKAMLESLGLKPTPSTGIISNILTKLNLSTGSTFNAILTEGKIENALAATTLTTNPNTTWGTKGIVSEIKFSSDYLNKMTDMKVAATMIHEYIHAYFDWNAYLIRNGLVGADDNFQQTYAFLFDKKTGTPLPDDNRGATQHRQMAESFTAEIASMLKNYAIAKKIPMPADLKYFEKMAWGGLLGTEAGKLAPEGTQYTLSAEQGSSAATITQSLNCK